MLALIIIPCSTSPRGPGTSSFGAPGAGVGCRPNPHRRMSGHQAITDSQATAGWLSVGEAPPCRRGTGRLGFVNSNAAEEDMLSRWFAVAAIVLVACGGQTNTAVSHNNGGTGSLNLSVKADVDAVFSSTGSPTDLVVKIQ